jgi:hypothetical protein
MRRLLAIVTVAAMLLSPGLVFSSDHVVGSKTIQERLTQAQKQRDADSITVRDVLATPEAAAAATAMGTRIERLQGGLSTLTDQELRNLAVRAQALRTDPVAGYHEYAYHDVFMLFLIVALVAVILAAAD